MQLFAFGVNHHTAPVSIRERVAFPPDVLERALHNLTHEGLASEAVILSTCNRTEIYCNTHSPEAVASWLADFHKIDRRELNPYLTILANTEAVRHAFRVASGLDSMVLGETQILGQLKQAVDRAQSAGRVGTLLSKLFQRTFAVAKDVRTATEIGANTVSMSAAAVSLAERIFPSIAQQAVLLIGAGEMIELVATHFAARNPRRMMVINRTVERAHELCDRFGGEAAALTQLPELLHEFDIIITSTASPLPILGLGLAERALKSRRHRPMFMVDLAVPRDIEPEVKALEDVYLYTVDDLASVVQAGQAQRQAAVVEAEVIIDAGVQSFSHWLGQRDAVPLIQQLHQQADSWREAELARARKLLAKGDDPEAVLEALAKGLTQKMLHGALAELRSADPAHREQTMQAVQRLFLRQER